jgi:hypothetical protein
LSFLYFYEDTSGFSIPHHQPTFSQGDRGPPDRTSIPPLFEVYFDQLVLAALMNRCPLDAMHVNPGFDVEFHSSLVKLSAWFAMEVVKDDGSNELRSC